MTRAEPVALVKRTIQALLAIKAEADEILIIDNNHSDQTLYRPLASYCDSLATNFNVRFHHVDYISGYKAGALNLALQLMDDNCDYIVIIDSDYQVLPWARDSIANAIRRYPRHALLQFPQYYRDTDKPDIHAELNHYFSHRLVTELNQSRTLSTGTCAVVRRSALIKLGGWSRDSITEDAQLGVLMHLNGEKSQYINEVIATGVLPQTMADLIGQRRRWVYGNMQVLYTYLKMMAYQSFSSITTKQQGLGNSYSHSHNKTQPHSNAKHPKLSTADFVSVTDSRHIDVKHFRAHLSQLSAWVNFTGVLIVLQGIGLATLAVAIYLGNGELGDKALTILTYCYIGYGIFMGRKLLDYLGDAIPLLTPQGKRLSDIEGLGFTSTAQQYQNLNHGVIPFKKPLPSNRTQKIQAASKADDSNLTNLTSSVARQASKKKLSQGLGWVLSRSKKIMRRFPWSRSLQLTSSASVIDSDTRTSPVTKTPITARVRAWLVHLSFWELGALSWFPVLWGQKKPFVCTPKFDGLHSKGKSRMATFMALPKIVLMLNAITVLLVWSHSSALLLCALLVLIVKLAASWCVISNFATEPKVSHVQQSNTIVFDTADFDKPETPNELTKITTITKKRIRYGQYL